ncbi:histidine phosphatase family protein [Leucobacter massiliensis]|uniref:Histidine phosphatase family protein n=1 Tax=Leucobacter massiliensis TaxID=1686285 RepID=A0A2S9QSQ3_9MICO|nr:histidine phosphatase family protein [Leucobacter massiliensis]PRI12599.1 histidine phosphatase family protein [Leucobacter massiliensis]
MTSSMLNDAAIAVVRHGETDWNIGRRIQGRTEVPLNERGRAQAREAAGLLATAGAWRGIVASPLGRAAETARIIAAELGLAGPVLDPELLERDFGPAEGLLVPEAHERWPGLRVPGAESLETLAERGSRALLRHLREQPDTIVVAHGALIRAALTVLGGEPAPRILNGEAWLLEAAPGAASETRVSRLGAPAFQHPA